MQREEVSLRTKKLSKGYDLVYEQIDLCKFTQSWELFKDSVMQTNLLYTLFARYQSKYWITESPSYMAGYIKHGFDHWLVDLGCRK